VNEAATTPPETEHVEAENMLLGAILQLPES